ncbi:unnamed protein product [Cylindrotheca closterium]|uniref:Uncharacterized protein n=1 Tax=Cylindrotheca closterium TaxID=2856 RepID=A0AAD2G172_9STRA|nr:unnamed protein product [Cylindrotheca closterium]
MMRISGSRKRPSSPPPPSSSSSSSYSDSDSNERQRHLSSEDNHHNERRRSRSGPPGHRRDNDRQKDEEEEDEHNDNYSISDEVDSFSTSSLPTVFKRNGVGGSMRDDLSEITNIFSPKKTIRYGVDDSDTDDDDSTIDSSYKWELSNRWCTIIILIGAIIAVSVGTALLIFVGASQELPDSSHVWQPNHEPPPGGNATTTMSAPPTFQPTPPPTKPMDATLFIRPIIEPPSKAECKSIAAGKEYYEALFQNENVDQPMKAYFAIDMDVMIRNQMAYGGRNFVNLVLPEIQMAIQKTLLPLLLGCSDNKKRRQRSLLVTEYPILNAKVIKLHKKSGLCVQTPVSCYKISVELMLSFIEMGPLGPIVGQITELFTEQTLVDHLGLEFIIQNTDTTDVRTLDSPPSNSPSLAPSESPSTKPTSMPSTVPTLAPITASPTQTPTKQPSKTPTMAPSSSPTRFPTEAPSSMPTPSPSLTPTPAPSLTASDRPTEIPSVGPSMVPSTVPSISIVPSNGPSTIDSQVPSINMMMVSNRPTIIADSSSMPSVKKPSSGPSFQATIMSESPTRSAAPSSFDPTIYSSVSSSSP